MLETTVKQREEKPESMMASVRQKAWIFCQSNALECKGRDETAVY